MSKRARIVWNLLTIPLALVLLALPARAQNAAISVRTRGRFTPTDVMEHRTAAKCVRISARVITAK
jgi:hypothetical protein